MILYIVQKKIKHYIASCLTKSHIQEQVIINMPQKIGNPNPLLIVFGLLNTEHYFMNNFKLVVL